MRLTPMICALLLSSGVAAADTTVTIAGVGTRVGAIDTRVDRVTWSAPRLVRLPEVGEVWEIEGVVTGRGWGGTGPVIDGAQRGRSAHYDYQVTWLARWPRAGNGKTLVMYHHGGGPAIVDLARTDRAQHALNANRFAERLGDPGGSVPALVNKATYIATNRRGMLPGGFFAATFDPAEVPILTGPEADALAAAVGYRHPDLEAGDRVPAAIAFDSATVRDVDLALQQVVASVSGRTFREKIYVGTSAGAIAGSGLAFGCSALAGSCVRTGGNHATAYDAGSPRLFDGFIFNGFPYPDATQRADATHPIAAPVFFLQGRGDERYQHPIRMADELAQRGVTLDGNVWIWEIANQPHVARDTELVVAPVGRHAESNGPYLGAAIRNLRDLLSGEATPPPSQIAGRIADGVLVFDVEDGLTNEMPVRENLALDSIDAGPTLVVRTVGVGPDAQATARWQAVTARLPHVNSPIYGPSTTCRIGGYRTRFLGALFTAVPALIEAFGSFAAYRACVTAVVDDLAADNLYDPRVESATATAERQRALFP